ncbi:hypothetical protein AN218_04155 [Streptomyces nanshensis]|uniref:Uncharacterized protein n=2 Tax=Streptomyces nanshensis TaxID=518642 RepID=A0A1E7LAX8_9ACTN|nr:hypothetical protein AN218_04155 [Streptomyces nanshensis]
MDRPDLHQHALGALLRGDVAGARAHLVEALPDLLSAGGARVVVLRSRLGATADDVRSVRSRCHRALKGRALVALSPWERRDVLLVHPAGDQSASDDLAQSLRRLCPPEAGMQVGVGRPAPWGHLVESHATAVQQTTLQPVSRAVQRLREAGVPPLWMVLASVTEAREWAAVVTQMVADALRSEEALAELLFEGALTLGRGPAEAARALGGGQARQPGKRNALSRLPAVLQQHTETGGTHVDRALLHTWLRVQALAPVSPRRTLTSAQRTWENVRAHADVEQWAADLLGLLGDREEEDAALRTWFIEGGTSPAAAVLGCSERTVLERLRRASAALDRDLMHSKADMYEVLVALLVEDGEVAQRLVVHDPAAHALTARSRRASPTAASSFIGTRWSGVLAQEYAEEHQREIQQRVGHSTDVEFYKRLSEVMPLGDIFKAIRRFRQAATELAAAWGIEQIVDVGCLPPETSLMQAHAPRARWVLADDDPFLVIGIDDVLGLPPLDQYEIEVMAMDHAVPERMLADLADHRIDVSRPVALNYGKGSNFLTPSLARRTIDGLAPGSMLIMAQLDESYEDLQEGLEMMRRALVSVPARPFQEIKELFGGLPLVDPTPGSTELVPVEEGLVPIGQWRAHDARQGHPSVCAGVALVPPK